MAVIRYPVDSVLCVADIHLEATAPERIERFRCFLLEKGPEASAIYILGDLFTAWPGDEAGDDEIFKPLLAAFQLLHTHNVSVYALHGNHDFLMGQKWCSKAHITLIEDGHTLEWAGQQWILMHGDTLCTDDISYQAFRSIVRDAAWQENFLAQPLSARLHEIERVRGRSEQEKSLKPEGIMDVNRDNVLQIWAKHPEITGIIHGHTHRPARHAYRFGEKMYTRWVLPDWIRAPGFAILTPTGRILTLSY